MLGSQRRTSLDVRLLGNPPRPAAVQLFEVRHKVSSTDSGNTDSSNTDSHNVGHHSSAVRGVSSDMDDLIEDAQGGDHRAFEELVRRTYSDTYTLAFRLTGDEDDARDVVQETYLRVHKGLSRFRGDAQFSTWLHRITANCANTFLGRRTRQRTEPLTDELSLVDDSPQRNPEHRADVGDLRSHITDALRQLPPKLRAVVVLRDIYDLPHEAIAEELGITESAAKVRLHRARKRLRDRLYPLNEDVADVTDEVRTRAG